MNLLDELNSLGTDIDEAMGRFGQRGIAGNDVQKNA
jgi:hypothetical protein